MAYIKETELSNYPQMRWMKQLLIGHPGIIAGGCFKSVFSGDKPHDIDMFFREKADFETTVKYFKGDKECEDSYENKNVIAFVHKKTETRIECIRKIFGEPEEILDQFDFTIAKFAYEIKAEPDDGGDWHYEDSITYHEKFFEHLVMKRLVVDDKMPYPVSTFNRCFKYAKSGFFPCRETKLKIVRAIQMLPLVSDDELPGAMYEGHD